jgi:hypothetical protein
MVISPLQYSNNPMNDKLSFKCGNLRIAFLAFSLIFWIFSLIFLCQVVIYHAPDDIALKARAVNDFFGDSNAFMIGPGLVLATILYFVWNRQTLTWDNGLLIDDRPVTIEYYQIKDGVAGAKLIYLRSAGRLWILYPTTSQDNMRGKNMKIVKKEAAYNEKQVGLLESLLIASGATKKQFWFLTKGPILSFALMVLIAIIALS